MPHTLPFKDRQRITSKPRPLPLLVCTTVPLSQLFSVRGFWNQEYRDTMASTIFKRFYPRVPKTTLTEQCAWFKPTNSYYPSPPSGLFDEEAEKHLTSLMRHLCDVHKRLASHEALQADELVKLIDAEDRLHYLNALMIMGSIDQPKAGLLANKLQLYTDYASYASYTDAYVYFPPSVRKSVNQAMIPGTFKRRYEAIYDPSQDEKLIRPLVEYHHTLDKLMTTLVGLGLGLDDSPIIADPEAWKKAEEAKPLDPVSLMILTQKWNEEHKAQISTYRIFGLRDSLCPKDGTVDACITEVSIQFHKSFQGRVTRLISILGRLLKGLPSTDYKGSESSGKSIRLIQASLSGIERLFLSSFSESESKLKHELLNAMPRSTGSQIVTTSHLDLMRRTLNSFYVDMHPLVLTYSSILKTLVGQVLQLMVRDLNRDPLSSSAPSPHALAKRLSEALTKVIIHQSTSTRDDGLNPSGKRGATVALSNGKDKKRGSLFIPSETSKGVLSPKISAWTKGKLEEALLSYVTQWTKSLRAHEIFLWRSRIHEASRSYEEDLDLGIAKKGHHRPQQFTREQWSELMGYRPTPEAVEFVWLLKVLKRNSKFSLARLGKSMKAMRSEARALSHIRARFVTFASGNLPIPPSKQLADFCVGAIKILTRMKGLEPEGTHGLPLIMDDKTIKDLDDYVNEKALKGTKLTELTSIPPLYFKSIGLVSS